MGVIPRQLAMHVIFQALQDVVRPTAIKADQVNAARNDAKDFLFSDDRKADLRMWCDMAGLQFEALRLRAQHIHDNGVDMSRELDKVVEPDLSEDEETIH